MDTGFHKKLTEYCKRDYVAWHMPGHKRKPLTDNQSEAAKYLDVTELPGLDDLHAPTGELLDSQQALSKIYGSEKSYYMVNGSTGGILTAISAATKRGDEILMARNCHRSVYHAVALLGLTPIYLHPPLIEAYGIYGGVTVEQVEEALHTHPDIKAVVLTSPTYEGIVSDIAGIVDIAHQSGVYVIVDEAHGAHFTYDAQAIDSAVKLQADLVIESLHKTLPCYTQCAILHIGTSVPTVGDEIRKAATARLIERVERYLHIYQTTSPSYIFVADMEYVTAIMATWRNTEFPAYLERLRKYRNKWKTLRNIRLLCLQDVEEYGGYQYDESRIVLLPKYGSGEQLRRILEDDHGQIMEMASLKYALAISTVMDSEDDFIRLDEALSEIDRHMSEKSPIIEKSTDNQRYVLPVLEEYAQASIPAIAWEMEREYVGLDKTEGRIAGDYVTVYPPGIPICVPGERITASMAAYLTDCVREGLTVHGLLNETQEM